MFRKTLKRILFKEGKLIKIHPFKRIFLYFLLTLYFSPISILNSWSLDKDTSDAYNAMSAIVREFEACEKKFPHISKIHRAPEIKPFILHISPLYLASYSANEADSRKNWRFFLQTMNKLIPFFKETPLTDGILFPFTQNFLPISEQNVRLAQRVPFFDPTNLWDANTTWDCVKTLEDMGIAPENGYTKRQLSHAKILIDYELPHTQQSLDIILYLTKNCRELSKENIEKYLAFVAACEASGAPFLYTSPQWHEGNAQILIDFNLPLTAENLELILILKKIKEPITVDNIKTMKRVRESMKRTSFTWNKDTSVSFSVAWKLYAIGRRLTLTSIQHAEFLIQKNIPVTATNLSNFDHIEKFLKKLYGPAAWNQAPHIQMAFRLREHSLPITKNNLYYGALCHDSNIPLTQPNIDGLIIVINQLAEIDLHGERPQKFWKEALEFHHLGIQVTTKQDLTKIVAYRHLKKFGIPITPENMETARNTFDFFMQHKLWPLMESACDCSQSDAVKQFILTLPAFPTVPYCYDFVPLFHFTQAGLSLKEDDGFFSIASHRWKLEDLSAFFSVINLLIDFEMPITGNNITNIISISKSLYLDLYAHKISVYIKIIQKKQKIRNTIGNNEGVEHLLYTKLEITNDRLSRFNAIRTNHMANMPISKIINRYLVPFDLTQSCLYDLYLLENNLPITPENLILAEKLCPPAYIFNFEGLPWKNGHLKGFSLT